jgi:hypothetical protein
VEEGGVDFACGGGGGFGAEAAVLDQYDDDHPWMVGGRPGGVPGVVASVRRLGGARLSGDRDRERAEDGGGGA